MYIVVTVTLATSVNVGYLCSTSSGWVRYFTLSWKKFQRFGMSLACPYARVVVWTLYDQTEVGEILELHPPEIGSPVTPGMSLGTKIFVSKIFSFDEN